MRYLVWFVGIAALAIAYWTDVVLLRLIVTRSYPFERAAAPPPAAAPPARTASLDVLDLTDYDPCRDPAESPMSKSVLVNGLNAVHPQIHACYERFRVPGTAMVNVVIAKSGRVSSARVTGRFVGTPTGACVEAAVMTARFPRTLDGFATPYPYQLR